MHATVYSEFCVRDELVARLCVCVCVCLFVCVNYIKMDLSDYMNIPSGAASRPADLSY